MLSRLLTSVLVVVSLTIFSTTSEAARIAEQLLSVGRDQHRTEPQLQIQAKNPGLQSTVAKAADTTAFTTVTDESDGSSAGIQIVARQTLFDYGVQQALDVLTDRVTHLQIPDASKKYEIPIVGTFKLDATDMQITRFSVSKESARLEIREGFFHLTVSNISAALAFSWRWQEAGLQGSGDGELQLTGGTADYVFVVEKDAVLQQPQITVVTSSVNFDAIDLTIHSHAADWLYQAVLMLFRELIQREVNNGIAKAMAEDVPQRINQALATLPTRLSIQGLPFTIAFDYTLYTLTYVLVKGFGQVEVSPPQAASSSSKISSSAETVVARQADAEDTTGRPQAHQAGLLAGVLGKQIQQGGPSESLHGSARSLSGRAVSVQSGPEDGVRNTVNDLSLSRCPFEASPLPLPRDAIAAEPHMLSIYVHEATAACMLWAAHISGKLKYALVEGSIKDLHVTSDLLAQLIPELPKQYPGQFLRVEVETLDVPKVSFAGDSGATITLYYRTTVYIANDSLGNPKVASMLANLTLTALLDWEAITITAANALHSTEWSALPTDNAAWDGTVAWYIQNYGSLASMKTVYEALASSPVASMVSLFNAAMTPGDRWYAFSADVDVQLPAAA